MLLGILGYISSGRQRLISPVLGIGVAFDTHWQVSPGSGFLLRVRDQVPMFRSLRGCRCVSNCDADAAAWGYQTCCRRLEI